MFPSLLAWYFLNYGVYGFDDLKDPDFKNSLQVSSLKCPVKLINFLLAEKYIFDYFLTCRKTDCRLLSTHDDYSIMSKLPKDKTSPMTILRNPLDRIFSTYEFSIEVAARFLIHPNLTSATRMSSRIRAKKAGVSTLDIWPWKYLVPWMREDLFARVFCPKFFIYLTLLIFYLSTESIHCCPIFRIPCVGSVFILILWLCFTVLD